MKRTFFYLILFISLFINAHVYAQTDDDYYDDYEVDGPGIDFVDSLDAEDDPQYKSSIDYSVPDDFTGTFAEDDPDSDVYKENQMFGEEEMYDEDGNLIEQEDLGPTHLLKLDFESQVLVTDIATETAYLEIGYTVKLEQEIEVVEKRFRTKGEAVVTTDIVGVLGSNELFSCKLDIQLEKVTVDIMTRYQVLEETEEQAGMKQLALQLKFNRDGLLEDWFSNCLGTDGSNFNTKGDKERYLLTIMDAVKPDLKGILIEDYFKEDDTSLNLLVEPVVIDDEDTKEEYLLQGSGVLEIIPF